MRLRRSSELASNGLLGEPGVFALRHLVSEQVVYVGTSSSDVAREILSHVLHGEKECGGAPLVEPYWSRGMLSFFAIRVTDEVERNFAATYLRTRFKVPKDGVKTGRVA